MRWRRRSWTVSIMLIACVGTFSLALYAYLAQSVASTVSVLKLDRKLYSSRPQLIDESQASVSEKIEPETVTDTCDSTKKAEITTQLLNQYLLSYSYQLDRSPWAVAEEWVMPTKQLYPERAPELGAVLHAMQREITAADVYPSGTKIKLSIMLNGNQTVIFKPKRILELRWVPMATGRVIDLERLLGSSTTTDRLKKTFSREGDSVCFYGECSGECKPERPVCGDGAMMEGAMVLRLPPKYPLNWHEHPWKRDYLPENIEAWHKDDEYCYRKVLPKYDIGIVLDIVDMSILNYIIQNGDQHHFMTFKNWNSSRVVMLDNANGFGDPNDDLRSLLAPLYQCCRVRMRTYNQLKFVYRGNLGSVLGAVLALDMLAPVLSDAHLRAVDRRLLYVINEIRFCIERHSAETVLNTSD